MRQEKSLPLKKVPEVLFERENIKVTLVGFYTPASAAVLNTPVYHFHFISDDKSTGGHVKDCSFSEAIIAVDYASELHVHLSSKALTQNIDLNKEAKAEK